MKKMILKEIKTKQRSMALNKKMNQQILLINLCQIILEMEDNKSKQLLIQAKKKDLALKFLFPIKSKKEKRKSKPFKLLKKQKITFI